MNVFRMLYDDQPSSIHKQEWEITSVWDDTAGASWTIGDKSNIEEITIDMVDGEMSLVARFNLRMKDGSFISLDTKGKDFRYRKINED
jgi:hypothetical protein